MTSHPYSHTKDSILSLWVQFCFPFFKCGQQGQLSCQGLKGTTTLETEPHHKSENTKLILWRKYLQSDGTKALRWACPLGW